jgi:hypothetical protein
VAEVEWKASDSHDLIRRDRKTAISQGIPVMAGAALFALWLGKDEADLAAVFVGMFIAWLLSVIVTIVGAPRRWRVLELGPTRVVFDDLGITWLAPHGSRLLRWDAVSISRLGNTWILSVRGHETAFVPARYLDANESSRLEGRVGQPGPAKIGP